MIQKLLFVFTSPNWSEFRKIWAKVEDNHLTFADGTGKLVVFDGEIYYLAGSDWDFAAMQRQLMGKRGDPIQTAVLIHDPYDVTRDAVQRILDAAFPDSRTMVYPYGGSENTFFKSFITPIKEGLLAPDHFDRMWDFIWTNDWDQKAREYRDKTLLPFLALDLLATARRNGSLRMEETDYAKCYAAISTELQEETSQWHQAYFDAIGLPQGRCLRTLKALQRRVGNDQESTPLQEDILTLLTCLDSQWAKSRARNKWGR